MTQPGYAYTLIGPDGKPYASMQKGTIGGHRRMKIFGRLDCPAALRAIARSGYVRHRVFFADQAIAIQAGYRPCAICMPGFHRAWKARQAGVPPTAQPVDGAGNCGSDRDGWLPPECRASTVTLQTHRVRPGGPRPAR